MIMSITLTRSEELIASTLKSGCALISPQPLFGQEKGLNLSPGPIGLVEFGGVK